MNIGVMGGTFDPVHLAHIAVAEEAKRQVNLEKVIFIPAGKPWLKVDSYITPAEKRLKMLQLALSDKPEFEISTMEIDRTGYTYTIDTISELKANCTPEDELFFIMGYSSLAELPEWKEPSLLIKLCRLVVAPRLGHTVPDMNSLEEEIPGLSDRIILLDRPEMDVSASEIRGRVRQGLSISHLVPEAVESYIKQNRLYIQ